eukprot:g33220.t1
MGKSIASLSDHALQLQEIKVFSRGLNFCPNTKMGPIGFVTDTEELIRRMKLWEFYQDVSFEPNETTNELDQLPERSMGERTKEESNWTPPEGCCLELDRYAEAIRERMNARIISRTHKAVQIVTQPQGNAICALQNNSNIVIIKPADKGGAIYFPGAEKLYHVLRSLQHIIDDDEHLTKIFPTPPLLIFKQLPNLKQTIVRSKLPSFQDNIDHNTIQPRH